MMSVKEEPGIESFIKEEDASENVYDRSQLPHLLKIYYKSLFPYDKYFEWLQYGRHSSSYE